MNALPLLGSIPLVFLLFAAVAVAPGAVVLRGVRLPAGMRLSAVVGCSLLLAFLAWWLLWLCGVPSMLRQVLVTGGVLGCVILGRRPITRLFRRPIARYQALGCGALALHACLLHAAVFCYSGALWGEDWCFHAEQATFWLADGDTSANRFPAGHAITERPPMMNVLAGYLWGVVGTRFANYQIIMTLLNSLACLPAFVAAGRLARLMQVHQRAAVALTTAGLMTLPAFAQNAVYPWTKLLAAFYVLLGVMLWTMQSRSMFCRPLAAAVAFAAGVLVHYSAAVALVVVAAHELVVLFVGLCRRQALQQRVVADVAAATIVALILSPWIGWGVLQFGVTGTVSTNTAVRDAETYTLFGNAVKIWLNLVDTVVPFCLQEPTPLVQVFQRQASWLGRVRDLCFLPYQVNFPTAVGTAGCALIVPVIGVLWRVTRQATIVSPRGNAAWWFWGTLATGFLLLGVAVHGGRCLDGLAHICLQPLMILGVVAIVVVLPRLPQPLQVLACLGAVTDYLLGVLLQAAMQAVPFAELPSVPGMLPLRNTAGLSVGATFNLRNKLNMNVLFLGDSIRDVGIPPTILLAVAVILAAVTAALAWWWTVVGNRHD